MGMGKGLLDSLIAEGGVKSRDLSWVIYIGVVIEIRRVGVIGMQLNYMAIPTSTFYLEEIFLRSLVSILFLCN